MPRSLPRRSACPGLMGLPGLTILPTALLAALLAFPAVATTLLCTASGQQEVTARIDDAWGEKPVLSGKSGPLPVMRFIRGTTAIFDARREVLYFESSTHAFAYALMGKGIVTLRGTCEEGT